MLYINRLRIILRRDSKRNGLIVVYRKKQNYVSKLGSLLFILYINNLAEVMSQSKLHMFIHIHLFFCDKWARCGGVNVEKTKCIVMGKPVLVEETEMSQSIVLMG